MTNLRDQLITVADAFAAVRGLSRARISTLVFNAGGRLDQIASGKDLTTRNFEHAMAYFSSNWPEGSEWPAGIDRPKATAA